MGFNFAELAAQEKIEREKSFAELEETASNTILPASVEDMVLDNNTTVIPDEIANCGGLIAQGLEAMEASGMPMIPQYTVPVIITAISRAISGKLRVDNIHPNTMTIKVGPTSSGKSTADSILCREIYRQGSNTFYGPTDFASGPALFQALMGNPSGLVVIDEATALFRRYAGKPDATADGKRDALLEIYSKSGLEINKTYAQQRNCILIKNPCMSLIGNATPVIFDEVSETDFNTGMMQRFDFWCYDGPTPHRGHGGENPQLTAFVAALLRLHNCRVAGGNLREVFGESLSVPCAPEVRERMAKLSTDIINRQNASLDDADKGLIGRTYDLSIKYAMAHHASTVPLESLGCTLSMEDLEWGIQVANMLSDWKVRVMRSTTTSGDFHRRCEYFKKAIRVNSMARKSTTFKTMANRSTGLKNWKPHESDEVIKVLIKRGEILALEVKNRPTSYQLARKNI